MQVHGKADIAVGLFNRRECGTLNYIAIPRMNTMTWCVPLLPERKYIFVFLLNILQPAVWAAIVFCLVLVIFFVLALRYLLSEPMPTKNTAYVGAIIFATVPMKCRTSSEKVLIAAWLLSCLVLRSLYEGELKVSSRLVLALYPQQAWGYLKEGRVFTVRLILTCD